MKILERIFGKAVFPKYEHLELLNYRNPESNKNEIFLVTQRSFSGNGWLYEGRILEINNSSVRYARELRDVKEESLEKRLAPLH